MQSDQQDVQCRGTSSIASFTEAIVRAHCFVLMDGDDSLQQQCALRQNGQNLPEPCNLSHVVELVEVLHHC